MRILSIHDGHNAAVALADNGAITFAVQEERLTNVKNYFGFPERSVARAMSHADIGPQDIDRVVLSSHYISAPMDSQDVSRRFAWQGTAPALVAKKLSKLAIAKRLRETRSANRRLGILSRLGFSSERVTFADHHESHAASAYYGLTHDSDSEHLVLTLDGGGDWLCATVSKAKKGALARIAETPYGHSIGDVYSRITYMMGFTPWEHEYKLMGMAPYASKEHSRRVADILHGYLGLDPQNPMRFRRKTFEDTNHILRRLERDLLRQRFDSIAGGVQLFTEELVLAWVKACVAQTGIGNILASGGVFMNIKANKLISELPEVTDFQVFPSCGDESNVFGASWLAACEAGENPCPIRNYYLGPAFTDAEIEAVLREESREGYFSFTKEQNINEWTAQLLAEGQIVARATGRLEFGARALGNRSIFADPSRQSVVPVINSLIKSRDFWMPFAPIALADKAGQYVRNPKHLRSPYMMMGFDTTERRSDLIAGIHPSDKSARMQILERGQNPAVEEILERFEEKTGRAVLLNTSFNLHGFPIVLGPREALDVFKRSGLTHLVMGDYRIIKEHRG